MRILLAAVNAKYIHSNLAVYSLRASAGAYASRIDLVEYTINHRLEEIFRDVYVKKPQLLFLSCYIWNRSILLELAEDLRRVLPGLRIWIGGPEVSYDAEEFLASYPQFDGVMRGEGERTFRELIACYVEGTGTLGEICGITYRDSGGVIRSNPARPSIECLDELPFVYQCPEDFEHRIIYYESSRGCPFGCSYCLSSIDRHVRFRSVELVEQELSVFLEHRVPLVKFVDRTFNANHARTMRLWRFLKEHDNGITCFHFEIAADLLNEEELELLAGMRPGLIRLEIGVQTVNCRTLDAIHRTAGFGAIAERVKRISGPGNVHQHLDLIAGLPYEDFESFGRSFDAVYRLHPQELQLGFLKVLRGSEMYRHAKEFGLIFRSSPPYEVLETCWISCGELMRLKEIEEMLEVYYNSGQFRNTIDTLEGRFERPFLLYGALAGHDKEIRMPGQQYSRQQRFAFLRGFVRSLGLQADAEAHFDELLTLDYYLRENAKTRPAWAVAMEPYKAEIIDFYRREEQERQYLPGYRDMTWKQLMRMTHLERFASLSCGNVPGLSAGLSCGKAGGSSAGLSRGKAGSISAGLDCGKAGSPSACLSCGNVPVLSAGGEEETADGRDKRASEIWVLFDYSRRDPVTGDAAVCIVELRKDAEHCR